MNDDEIDETARAVRAFTAKLNEAADALAPHIAHIRGIREQLLGSLTAEVRDGVLSGSPEAHEAQWEGRVGQDGYDAARRRLVAILEA